MRFAIAAAVCQLLAIAQSNQLDLSAERAKANELYLQGHALDALPLYEDLARRDPKVAVFAERYAAGLIAKSATLTDDAQKKELLHGAYNELLRARSLGDNSPYLTTQIENFQRLFSAAKPTPSNSNAASGNRQPTDPQVLASMQAGESAFARNDYSAALQAYSDAATKDPTYYGAALFAGDTAFRMHDTAKAAEWFGKAVAIDPNVETAYRYWGDALLAANQPDEALEKFADAIVAQPYSNATWAALVQWSRKTGRSLQPPPNRPAECQSMHSVRTVSECVKAVSNPAIKRISDGGFLESWVLLNAADAQIAQEYAGYRAAHRDQLRDYILQIICDKSAAK